MTLLPNGKVLVTGGFGAVYNKEAEFYDPATGTWTLTGSLQFGSAYHTATLLPNGKVLAAGGYLINAQLYDPATGTWTITGRPIGSFGGHTATLLPNGKVLAAGGGDGRTAELYDPASGTWALTGRLNGGRVNHTATLLPNGQVLVAAGWNINQGSMNSAEIYDPAKGTWRFVDTLASARNMHTAVLLPTGKVLVAGGRGPDDYNDIPSAELYDVGLSFSSDWQPVITRATITGNLRLRLTGSRFQGISQASGGTFQDSSSNYPVVQLRAIGNDQVRFLFVDPERGWSDTTFGSLPPTGFVAGPALVTVFTNGIPSDAKYILVPQ